MYSLENVNVNHIGTCKISLQVVNFLQFYHKSRLDRENVDDIVFQLEKKINYYENKSSVLNLDKKNVVIYINFIYVMTNVVQHL